MDASSIDRVGSGRVYWAKFLPPHKTKLLPDQMKWIFYQQKFDIHF